MKNIPLILLIVLCSAFNSFGQGTPTPIGAKNSSLEVLGGMKVDSAFKLPIVAITARFTKGGLDTNGYIFAASTDSLPRFMKKGTVVRMYTDYDTANTVATRAYINTRIQQLIDDTSLTIAELGFGLIRLDTILLVDSSKIATYNYVSRTFIRWADTSGNLYSRYAVDTAKLRLTSAINTKLNSSDTAALSSRINLKQNFTDTTTWDATKANLNTAAALRILYSDTGSLIYTKYDVDTGKARLTTSINTKLNSSDTASLSSRINLKQNFSDTATYDATKAYVITAVSTKVNYADTASLSNRINLKQNFTDTATWDATKANLNSGLSTKANYTDTVRFAHKDANTDITSMSGISGAISSPTSITFTPTASPSYVQGRLVYDSDNECLTYYNNDNQIGLQIGQEDWIRVRNVSGSTITNGSAVYINGSSSGLPTIALAQANAGTTVVGAGLATESIPNNSTGYVTSIGVVHGLNTSGFSVGAVYISSSVAGGLTQTAPTSPNYRYRIGFVTLVDASAGTIHVTPSTGAIGNGTVGQVLTIDGSGLQSWAAPAAGGISTITSTNNSIRITGTTTTNLMVDTTKSTIWTSTTTRFVNDIIVDSSDLGTGGQSSFNNRFGQTALAAITTGSGNVAIGRLALTLITTVSGMTAVGDRAMGSATNASSGGVAIGQLALQHNVAVGNTAVGWMAISDATYSSQNTTCVGYQAGLALTSGGGHLFLGAGAGSTVTTGVSDVILGPFNGNSGGLDIRTASSRIVFNAGASIRAYCGVGGNWMFGGVTDNGTDKVQIIGSLAVSSLPAGLITDVMPTYNLSTGQLRSIQMLNVITATGNTTFSVPAIVMLMTVTFTPVGSETIQIGTTNGGVDVMAPTLFTAGASTTVELNKVFSRSGAQTIFINGSVGSTTYDVRIF